MNKMAIILAAGQGKRMKSKLYKVLHPVCGVPMVGHVLENVQQAGCARVVTIVGHGAEAVKGYLGAQSEFVVQAQQLGTGHAVSQAEPLLGAEEGVTVVVCGDTPLITAQTIGAMLEAHEAGGAAATVMTAQLASPTGYGRIIRDDAGVLSRIVEQKDCTPEEALVCEINTGTYCFDNGKLFAALTQVTNNNAQGEYYLTDVIGILQQQGDKVQAYCSPDPAEAIGVNDRVALAEAERLMQARIVRQHLVNGVTVIDPSAVYIDSTVTIGADTVLLPGCVLRGATTIGEDCIIGPQADLHNTTVADGVHIRHSVAVEAVIGQQSTVGPYAHLRPGTVLGAQCKIGDFVELKNAQLDEGAKVSHLSYIGDARVGKDVNIGCGAITVNYDGYNKAITEIGDGAFVGSNVNLIAPVKVGKGAYVVAGSTITQDVADNDVAIARERQVNKPGYAEKLRNRAKAKKERGGSGRD